MCISMFKELEPSKHVTFQELCFSPIRPFFMFPHAIPIHAQLPIHHALDLFQLSYTSSYIRWIILSRQLMKIVLKFRWELITTEKCHMSIVTMNKAMHPSFSSIRV